MIITLRSHISMSNSSWLTEHFLKRHRPRWWPENEDWPPHDRRKWRHFGKKNPFFRRFGCMFGIFTMLSIFIILIAAGIVLKALGIPHFLMVAGTFVPLIGLFVVILIVIVVIAGANLGRLSIPLDDLLGASSRVADGDYSVRVEERGPTEVRSLSKAFNVMAARLQTQENQRRGMLADVTHELRTPLTIIQGNLEGVLDGIYPADQIRIKAMLEETQVLSRLTDDLRTLAMAETGSLQLIREPVNIVRLANETALAFESQAVDAGVEIIVAGGTRELSINADPERIRQVMTNLISNALRYSPRGGYIEVSVNELASRSKKRVVVSVTDHGPGISESDVPHVFDRYFKSVDSRGMGLGLSIAKYIVETHGGEIKAESSTDTGTTIWFSLPS